jgi:hypothetical protein
MHREQACGDSFYSVFHICSPVGKPLRLELRLEGRFKAPSPRGPPPRKFAGSAFRCLRSHWLGPGADATLIEECYRSLRRQVPIICLLGFVNLSAMELAAMGRLSLGLNLPTFIAACGLLLVPMVRLARRARHRPGRDDQENAADRLVCRCRVRRRLRPPWLSHTLRM